MSGLGAIRALCGFGNCTVLLDERGRITASFGPVLCPCDHLPSWRRSDPDQRHRTSMSRAVKARGRHGSRVQRARARHRDIGPAGQWLPLVDFARELETPTDALDGIACDPHWCVPLSQLDPEGDDV